MRREEKSNGTFLNFFFSFFIFIKRTVDNKAQEVSQKNKVPSCSLDAKYSKSVIARDKLNSRSDSPHELLFPIYYFEISYIVRYIISRSARIKERGNVFTCLAVHVRVCVYGPVVSLPRIIMISWKRYCHGVCRGIRSGEQEGA